MTDITDNDQKAKAVQEQFAKAMSGEVEKTGEVIEVKDFLKRRVEKIAGEAQKHFERAQSLHVRQGQSIEQDPYAAPLLSLGKQKMAETERWVNQIQFIERKEQEIAAQVAAVAPVSKPVAQITPIRPHMNWGMGLSFGPTKTGDEEPK